MLTSKRLDMTDAYVEPFSPDLFTFEDTASYSGGMFMWTDHPRVFTRRSRNYEAPIALAQFEQYQLPVGDFDPMYPSALHASDGAIFMSYGRLRYMMERTLGQLDSVVIHRRYYKRFDDNKNAASYFGDTLVKHPGALHCLPRNDANKEQMLRTLEDIVSAIGETDANQPWNLLNQNYQDFKDVVTANMPVIHATFRDLARGPTGENGDAVKVRVGVENADRKRKNGESMSGVEYAYMSMENLKDQNIPSGYGSVDDSARILSDYFASEYIKEHLQEAKLLYIMVNWQALSQYWFEVYRSEDVTTSFFETKTRNPVWKNIQNRATNVGVVAYKLELQDDFHCLPPKRSSWSTAVDAALTQASCGKGFLGKRVYKNVVRCGPCTSIPKTLCKGRTKCGPKHGVKQFLFKDENFDWTITSLGVALWEKVRAKIAESLQLHRNHRSDYYAPLTLNLSAPLFGGRFESAPLTWTSFGGEYNPIEAMSYEANTGVLDKTAYPPALKVDACVEGSSPENLFVDYTACDMDTSVQHLNASVFEKYMLQRGVLVDTYERVSWVATQKQFTENGVVPYWTVSNRPARDRFVSWALNDIDHCKNGGAHRFNTVCWKDPDEKIHVFNPWLGGDFSVGDLCDNTQQETLGGGRRMDTKCDENVCLEGKQSNFSKEQWRHPSYPLGTSCWGIHGQPVGKLVVPDDIRVNLCTQTPRRNATCMHAQGTLAGPGQEVGSVYERLAAGALLVLTTMEGGTQLLEDVQEGVGKVTVEGGLFVHPRHAVFYGHAQSADSGKAGLFRVDAADIAGHHLRFEISDDGLRMSDVMLQSYTDLANADSQDGVGLTWLQFSLSVEDGLAAPTVSTASGDWACPLRQQAFLSHETTVGNRSFNAKFPDNRRARVLFSKANSNMRVHPTQKAGAAVVKLVKQYYSANGVCACATADECRTKAAGNQDEYGHFKSCGFMDTVNSLFDQRWRESAVLDKQPCTHQMDWPYTGGKLRDGTTIDHTVDAECGLLSRLPPYRYRYAPVPWLAANRVTPSTLHEHGDCHTGRLPDVTGEQLSGCELVHRNASHLVLECQGNATQHNATQQATQRIVVLPRKMQDTPRELLQRVHTLRRRCDQCSAAPTFHTAAGTEIPAESSITHPYRVSSERRLAGQLRNDLAQALCGNVTGCVALDNMLNGSQWVPHKFWGAFVGDVRQLLRNNTAYNVGGDQRSLRDTVTTDTDRLLAMGSGENDDLLWQQKWLFCEQGARVCNTTEDANGVWDEVCVNAPLSDMTCYGTMEDKNDWLDPSKRTAATLTAFISAAEQTDSLVEEMNVCDLDDVLSEFCSEIAAARSAVFDANCLAAGKCFEEMFFYQPSQFSLSNNEFARQTVEAFYTDISPGVCSQYTSARTARLVLQNQVLAQKCGARLITDIKTVVQLARQFVGVIVRSGYFLGMVLLHSVRLIIPLSETEEVMESIRMYLDLMMDEMSGMMTALGEVVVEMIMDNTETGKFISDLLEGLCKFQKFMLNVFMKDMYCPMKQTVDEFMKFIGQSTNSRSGECKEENFNKSCTLLLPRKPPIADRVDASTRCWSSYVNSLGDAMSLSCSASDSCLYDGAGSKNGLIVCDACPRAFAADFTRYGCDTVRKQCKCGVQSITRSACINHAQCQVEGATCDMLETSFEVTPWATSPCTACENNAMCVEATGGARCTCSVRQQALAMCRESDRGTTIVPEESGLCLVTLGESVSSKASRSLDYSMYYEELATAPCDFLDTSQSFCMLVSNSATQFGYFVVGVKTLTFGSRRLLSHSPPGRLRGQYHISAADLDKVALQPWQHVRDDGCRMVAQRFEQSNHTADVSVSDTVLYSTCLRWRAIGDDVMQTYNLSVHNTFLLSSRDMVEALTDTALFFKMVRHPDMVPYILFHTEAAAPWRALARSARIWVYHHIGWLKTEAEVVKLKLMSNRTYDKTSTSWDPWNQTNTSTYRDRRTRLYTAHHLRNVLMHATAPLMASPLAAEVAHEAEAYTTQQLDILSDWVDDNAASLEVTSDSDHSLQAINRRLLVFQDSMDAVREYSIQLSLGDGATQLLGAKLVDDFEKLPIAFPPISLNWDQGAECTAVRQLGLVVADCASLLLTYFSTLNKNASNLVERGLLTSFPSFTAQGSEAPTVVVQQDSLAAALSNLIFEKILSLSPSTVRTHMLRVPDTLKSFLVCDVNTVMFCSEFRYSLFSGAVVVAVLTFVVAVILRTIGIPYVWTITGALYIPLVFFYSFGVSPLCFPMIPSCLGNEILEFLNMVIPDKLSWPQSLQKIPNCAEDASISASECIVTCEQVPFVYLDWTEPLAWVFCDVAIDACIATEKWLSASAWVQGISTLKSLSEALDRSAIVLQGTDDDMKTAFRLCAALTSWKTVPILLLCGLGVYALPMLLLVPFQLFISLLQLGVSTVTMSHLRWGE